MYTLSKYLVLCEGRPPGPASFSLAQKGITFGGTEEQRQTSRAIKWAKKIARKKCRRKVLAQLTFRQNEWKSWRNLVPEIGNEFDKSIPISSFFLLLLRLLLFLIQLLYVVKKWREENSGAVEKLANEIYPRRAKRRGNAICLFSVYRSVEEKKKPEKRIEWKKWENSLFKVKRLHFYVLAKLNCCNESTRVERRGGKREEEYDEKNVANSWK